MSRYYPSSRGGSRGSRGYYQNYQSRGGYQSSSSGGYQASGGGGHYDSRVSSGGSGGGRYYPSRDRRDSGSGGIGSTRNQLEIAKKLVDTLMQSSSSGRRPADHYSSGGEPPYKRPRDDSYDDRDRSRSRYSEHHHHRRDDYSERRPRHDDYRSAPAGRRPYRARGYAPRRGYVPRGAPTRRSYGDYDSLRERSFNTDRDDPREHPSQRMVVTKCPHCHARCATFADFRKHQLGRDHMSAMRRVLTKIREELVRMRLAQRQEQKELENAEAAKDPEAFEKLPSLFCALCRLQYKKLENHVHEETDHHVKQKAYQNPSCKTCNMTFVARISYEKHQGTFTHIQKTSQLERRERNDADEFEKGGFMTLDSVGDVDEGDRDENANGEGEQVTAAQKLEELKDYDGKTSVGSGYMRKTEVYHCGLCDIYIKITAKVNAVLVKHCMGKKHFENYRKKLAKMVEEEEERKAAAEAAAAAAAAEQAKEEAEDADAPQDNGHDEEAAGEDAVDEDAVDEDAVAEEDEQGDGPAGGEPEPEPAPGADAASWEQMDDNFILGDDQEEEPEKKSDVAE